MLPLKPVALITGDDFPAMYYRRTQAAFYMQ